MVSGISNQNRSNYSLGCQPIKQKVAFSGENKRYENPVNRSTEKALAVGWASFYTALAAGGTWLITRHVFDLPKKYSGPITVAASVLSALCFIPSAFYNAGVSSFARKKEMDVFSREKSVETGLTQGIDKNISNNEKPLEDNIEDYKNYKIGKNASNIIVNGSN